MMNGDLPSGAGAADVASFSDDLAGQQASFCDDNFWSTSFSAGNYNADNTEGYVSVPGYGPVDYGMD